MGLRDFDALQTKHFDIVVVGGGIYGATMVWEAASRGLSVALFEKQDFGHATSANSLKMIHGGIRYLQQLDLKRLRESVRERRSLLRIAPHLVTPIKCLFPTQNTLTENRVTVEAAFQLYNCLSWDRNQEIDPGRHIPCAGTINRKKMREIIPALKKLHCSGAGYWYDAQAHNTERLILSFVCSARSEGASVFNYAPVKTLLKKDAKVKGVVVCDGLSNKSYEIQTDSVIDCTGPWSKWHSEINDKIAKPVFAKAVNLLVKKSFFPCAVALKTRHKSENASSSRQLFIAPWKNQSLIGTWYFPPGDSAEHVSSTERELDECLQQANSLLPGMKIDRGDITAVQAGLLPAEVENHTAEPRLKNKAHIVDASKQGGPQGLFLVQGIKFTTARAVAESTIDLVSHRQGKRVKKSETDSRPLYGGKLGQVAPYYQSKKKHYSDRLEEKKITHLIDNYGTNIDVIMAYIEQDASLGQWVPGTTEVLIAELVFVLEHEMLVTLSDLLLRRIDLGALAMPSQKTIVFCADFLGKRLHWDEDRQLENINTLIASYQSLHQSTH
ncbi:MAG: glycerol-3-phosphate dehydrogenase/oxidase [Nitrospirae bacterium]|nr:glycerol-3-phosphate dehydrogenase/oxidase [Candidatus Manganitrophaceae bacterium]